MTTPMGPTFQAAHRARLDVWPPPGVRPPSFPLPCISLIGDEAVAAVRALGGIAAIAISHPHYYSSMVEWSQAFDAPVLVHAADRRWVMRPDAAVEYWEGDERPLFGGLTLLRLGGH